MVTGNRQDISKEFSLSTLEVTNAESYSLSIRLVSDGLNFDIFDTSTSRLLLSDSIVNKHNGNSITHIIEDIFFENAWLSFTFAKVRVLYEPVHWILIPLEMFSLEDAHIWLRSITENPFCTSSEKGFKVLDHRKDKDNKVILCDIQQDLFDFLSRNLIIDSIQPYFIDAIDYARDISVNKHCKVLQAFITNTAIDIIIVDKGEISKGNRYNFTKANDKNTHKDEILFFVISLYDKANLSNKNDRIMIMPQGNDDIDISSIAEFLRPYTSSVDIIDNKHYNENNIW